MSNLNKNYKSNEIVNYYSSNRNKWSDFYKSEKEIIKKIKLRKNYKILDVGSACGGLGQVLKKRYGIEKYVGIELNKQAYNYARNKFREFKFYNKDLLNFEKEKKNYTKFDIVFSFGCIDWNIEFRKMLIKAWKHVKINGYFVFTIRLSNKLKKNQSYQFINFSKKLEGEKAPYHVLTLQNFKSKIKNFRISKFIYSGYWGQPNKTVITKYKKVFFMALALKKDKKKNHINFRKLKKMLIKYEKNS